jgi:hypothetical protein
MENNNWLKNLKVGDEVVIDLSSIWKRHVYEIHTIEKITPTGRFKLSNNEQYYPDGRKVGGKYGDILKQVTPEILELMKRKRLLTSLKFDEFAGYLSSERLELLHEWKNELLKNNKK